jgi:hypothetical protein
MGAIPTQGRFTYDVNVAGTLAFVADGEGGFRVIDFGPEYRGVITVPIDIRPGDARNAINPLARGVVPVAILGIEGFEPEVVDATTLTFGPALAAPVHRKGGHFEDVDADGLSDLLSHYAVPETGIAIGATEACVTGRTRDGVPFRGCDSVTTVRRDACGLGFELVLAVALLMWTRARLQGHTPV